MTKKMIDGNPQVRIGEQCGASAKPRRLSSRCKAAAMSLALGVAAFSGLAEQVSSDLAALAVNTMIAQEGQMESPIKGQVSSVRLCTTTNGAAFYVAKLTEGGFVVTSTDTEIDPIIAFSPASDLVEDPRNPLWALLVNDMAERQKSVVAYGKTRAKLMSGKAVASPAAARWASLTTAESGGRLQSGGASRSASRGASDGAGAGKSDGMKKISDVRVAPLLKTKWGQDKAGGAKCFNYYTPNNYPCGCTATAGAQILRYHKFPKESVKPRSYNCKVNGKKRKLTQKGGKYEWDKMPYVPGKGTTEAQRKAIGKLTYDVGVAVLSEYSKNETWGYGANFVDLCLEWGYAHATTFWYRSFHPYDGGAGEGFTEDELMSILIPNLDAKLPVAVRIYNIDYEDDTAHFAVADGYGYMWDAELLCVHLNMGWKGNSDAWYVLPDFRTGSKWYNRYTTINYLYGNIYPDGPETAGIVSGRVLSSSTSKPVSGIVVTARSNDGEIKYATTDAKGIYSFILPGSGGMVWDEDKWPDDDWYDDDWYDDDWNGDNNYGESDPKEGEEGAIEWQISVENTSSDYEDEYPSSYSRDIRDSENHYGLDFAVNIYTVTFDANGGSGGISSRKSNVVGTLPPTARRGYTLKGWFTARNGGTEVTESTLPTGDMTCYAQWEPNSYRVAFGQNGGSGYMEPMEFVYDEAQALPPNTLSKAGASFRGWSLSPDKTVSFADGESVKNLLAVPGTVVLYAVWADDNAVTADVGVYFQKKTLAELGYAVPTDGKTAYSVVAKGLPAGLKLMSNKAVTKKVGKKTVVVTPANVEWWIEGVPTATLDFATNPPYLVITVDGETTTEPLLLESLQKVTELGGLMLGESVNTNGWLEGVGAGWSVSGLPTGLSFATKKVTKKSGKATVTVAEAYSVYGKTTKAGFFTITAKKKNGAYFETKKFRVLVAPAAVDATRFGDSLADMTTMAYVPMEWDLVNGGFIETALPAVSAVGGKVTKVTGLPAGLTFAAADTYGYANPKKKTGKYLKQKGQTIVGTPKKAGAYLVTFTKNVTSGKKTVAKTAQILWTVVENDAELELWFNDQGGGVIENCTVGLEYGDLMAFTAMDGATVTASGLPSGIQLEDFGGGTYAFTGFATKAGTYLVTVTATLNGKSVTQRLALEVGGLPVWATGTFNGVVRGTGNGEGGTDEINGLATITVSAAGKISGKFYEGGTNWTLSAASYTGYDPYASNCTASVTAKYSWKVKSGKKTVTNTLTRDFALTVAVAGPRDACPYRGVAKMTETGGSPSSATEIMAWQNVWGMAGYKALGKKLFSTKSGKKTLAYRTFTIKGTDEAGKGIGLTDAMTLSMKVTTAGAVTATLAYDTGKKDKKTKKTIYCKPTCSTVLIPTSAADAEPFTGNMYLHFAPSKDVFGGWSEKIAVTLTIVESGVVMDVALGAGN